MEAYLSRVLKFILIWIMLGASSAFGGCLDEGWGGLTKCTQKETKKVLDVGDRIVVQPVKHAAEGVGTVLEGGYKILVGNPEGTQILKRGAQKLGQAAVEAVPLVVTAIVPVLGSILVLGPDAAKFIYEVTQKWKGHPACNPQEQINRLMTKPKRELYDFDRIVGAATTIYKYLASATGGYGGWDPTGCDAIGIGRPIRNAQKGSDGFWTVDVALSELRIQDKAAPPGRFIRLEILPDRDASTSAERHPPTTQDVIGFKGPLVWDGDSDPPDHPHGHMEMHPMAAIEFFVPTLVTSPPQPPMERGAASGPAAAPSGASRSTETAGAPFSPLVVPKFITTYTVAKHDCLSKIAERMYGTQSWRKIYAANRKAIRNPDLIYPGQVMIIPPP